MSSLKFPESSGTQNRLPFSHTDSAMTYIEFVDELIKAAPNDSLSIASSTGTFVGGRENHHNIFRIKVYVTASMLPAAMLKSIFESNA